MKHYLKFVIFFLMSQSLIAQSIRYAKGFEIDKDPTGITRLTVTHPWPNSSSTFKYYLVSKDSSSLIDKLKTEGKTVIPTPVEKVVMTSTTQIPALPMLNRVPTLIGFTGLDYISDPRVRTSIDQGKIQELGMNERINIEKTIVLHPEVLFGFSINDLNKNYDELSSFGIPIVYNGDWVETTPLGKAEWIKFTAAFFEMGPEAAKIFTQIEKAYLDAKALASTALDHPRVMSGALYQDVWYTPGAQSWAAQFLKDANCDYLFSTIGKTGSSALSLEEVINKASTADYWISPDLFTSYQQMNASNTHYSFFNAFKNKKIYTYALTQGEKGGFTYFELASQRPDLVLKDLIYILHPKLLLDYTPTFYKPLTND